jgi:hypothetical protein
MKTSMLRAACIVSAGFWALTCAVATGADSAAPRAADAAQAPAAAAGPTVTAVQIAAVRKDFTGYDRYGTPAWYDRYPMAWRSPRVEPAAWWTAPAWPTVQRWCGSSAEPVSYEYGKNVLLRDGMVYYGEKPIAQLQQYYERVHALAQAGIWGTEDQHWLPLGIFALVSGNETEADRILQLAVNPSGLVRGNLHDALGDAVWQILGTVDKPTQRVALRTSGGTQTVTECGLWNLTQETVPLWVHFGTERRRQRTLVRLTPPR